MIIVGVIKGYKILQIEEYHYINHLINEYYNINYVHYYFESLYKI